MNLGQLQTAIQAMGYTTDTAAVQTYALNQVYRTLVGERDWPWLEKQNTSLTTTIGSDVVSVASITDFQQIDAVRLEIGTEYDSMQYLPPEDLRDLEHVDRANGTPYYWTFNDQAIKLYPRPDRVYTVDVDYIQSPADLVNPTDIPIVPLEYHDVLVWGAVAVMAFRERDWLGRQFADAQYQAKHANMVNQTRQRQTSSHVKSSGWLNNAGSLPWTPWSGS